MKASSSAEDALIGGVFGFFDLILLDIAKAPRPNVANVVIASYNSKYIFNIFIVRPFFRPKVNTKFSYIMRRYIAACNQITTSHGIIRLFLK